MIYRHMGLLERVNPMATLGHGVGVTCVDVSLFLFKIVSLDGYQVYDDDSVTLLVHG